MKYTNGQFFISKYIMESYEVVGFNEESGKYKLNVYGEKGVPDGFVGPSEESEENLEEHYTAIESTR